MHEVTVVTDALSYVVTDVPGTRSLSTLNLTSLFFFTNAFSTQAHRLELLNVSLL